MYCDNCGAWLEDDASFCGNCGAAVAKTEEYENKKFCGKCGAEMDINERFCGKCGALAEDADHQADGYSSVQHEDYAKKSGNAQGGKKKSGSNVIIIITVTVITVLVLAGAAYIGYRFINDGAEDSDNNHDITEVQRDKDKDDKNNGGEPEKKTEKPDRTPKPEGTEKPERTEKPEETEQPEDSKDYMFPSDTRYITDEELDKYSQEEVRLILNELYARHGYIFTTDTYRQYFESKDWYRPSTSSQSEAQSYFNAIEESNRIVIINYETKKGWR